MFNTIVKGQQFILTQKLNSGNHCVYWCHYDHWCIQPQYRTLKWKDYIKRFNHLVYNHDNLTNNFIVLHIFFNHHVKKSYCCRILKWFPFGKKTSNSAQISLNIVHLRWIIFYNGRKAIRFFHNIYKNSKWLKK